MKRIKFISAILALILALSLAFVSCDMQGEQGIQGAQGEKGDQGEAGVGIAKVEIINGEFVITYTDGSVKNIGALVQNEGTEGLEYYPLPDGTYGVMAGTTKYLEEITIPATYNGKPVTKILPEAFSSATNLKKSFFPTVLLPLNIQHSMLAKILQI